MQCTSVAELIELLPVEYGEALRKEIFKLADAAYHYQQVVVQCAQLEGQANAGTLPSFIKGIKPPTLQASKEVKLAHGSDVKAFKNAHLEYQVGMLSLAVDLKRKEVAILLAKIQHANYLPTMINIVKQVFADQARDGLVPVNLVENQAGEISVETFGKEHPMHQANYVVVLHELPAILQRVV